MAGPAAVSLMPATPASAEALAALHAAAMPAGEAWSAASIATELGLPGVFGLLEAGGGMVLARVAADQAEILALAVAPGARRAGRGGALLAEAERLAARRGARQMFLEVAEGNAAARALYARAGYRPLGRRRAYYASGEDALVLGKALAETTFCEATIL